MMFDAQGTPHTGACQYPLTGTCICGASLPVPTRDPQWDRDVPTREPAAVDPWRDLPVVRRGNAGPSY